MMHGPHLHPLAWEDEPLELELELPPDDPEPPVAALEPNSETVVFPVDVVPCEVLSEEEEPEELELDISN
jgi:hypothetical protein